MAECHSHVTREPIEAPAGTLYTCPMHPEVRQTDPSACPKCGMALDPESVPMAATRTQYTCPMHPEIERDAPGDCPICGMALEPVTVTVEEQENPELVDMSRRFWVSATAHLAATGHRHGRHDSRPCPSSGSAPHRTLAWLELALATPVVLWGGWPFFQRGWASLVNRHLNMFTLIALGTGVAYAYSVIATVAPDLFPEAFRDASGRVAVYFEAAAMIVTLVLVGQVMELRARHRTGAAIRALLGLAPKDSPAHQRRRQRGRRPPGACARWRSPAGASRGERCRWTAW